MTDEPTEITYRKGVRLAPELVCGCVVEYILAGDLERVRVIRPAMHCGATDEEHLHMAIRVPRNRPR